MKKLKIFLIILSSSMLIGCNDVDSITRFVDENYQKLELIAMDYYRDGKLDDYKDDELISDISIINSYGSKVEFVMDGYGIKGYFYSVDDKPEPYQDIDANLVEYEKNKYTWNQDGNKGKVIKIRNNWYYFEADI